MLGGRVKTLHPRIHAAILARRDRAEDVADLVDAHEIEPFDLVVRQPLPVRGRRLAAGGRRGGRRRDDRHRRAGDAPRRREELRPRRARLQARAVRRRCSSELRARGELSLETRRRLAAETFAVTAAYEAAIAAWFSEPEAFPDSLQPVFTRELDLAYGENPHQHAAYYAEIGARRHLLSRVEQLHGRELSFNNLNDLSAARMIAREFDAARRA